MTRKGDGILPPKDRSSCSYGEGSTAGEMESRDPRGGEDSGKNWGSQCRCFARARNRTPRHIAVCAARDLSFSGSGSRTRSAPRRCARFKRPCAAITATSRGRKLTRGPDFWFPGGTIPLLFPARRLWAMRRAGRCKNQGDGSRFFAGGTGRLQGIDGLGARMAALGKSGWDSTAREICR